jgi:hypothetical protein
MACFSRHCEAKCPTSKHLKHLISWLRVGWVFLLPLESTMTSFLTLEGLAFMLKLRFGYAVFSLL